MILTVFAGHCWADAACESAAAKHPITNARHFDIASSGDDFDTRLG
jgi:hypothetical protein